MVREAHPINSMGYVGGLNYAQKSAAGLGKMVQQAVPLPTLDLSAARAHTEGGEAEADRSSEPNGRRERADAPLLAGSRLISARRACDKYAGSSDSLRPSGGSNGNWLRVSGVGCVLMWLLQLQLRHSRHAVALWRPRARWVLGPMSFVTQSSPPAVQVLE